MLEPNDWEPAGDVGETTGRCLVLFEVDAGAEGVAALAAQGVQIAETKASVAGGKKPARGSETLYFEELAVAVVDAPPEQVVAAAGETRAIIAVEPERIVHVLLDGPGSPDYLRGYRDAVLHLTGHLDQAAAAQAGIAAAAPDEAQATWGLQAVRAANSCFTGVDIKLAVLDTGMDLNHPDFAGRAITSRSFIPGEAVQDGHGHGTHCIGTAAGTRCPAILPRYGVASGAEIFAGKVLSNAGSGTDSQILAGINWAVQNGCAVISMSLGARTRPGQPFSAIFEQVAARASNAGSLIIAAAGNDSSRPGATVPVSHPANCPSIMAVAALDVNMAVATFSNRGIDPNGGQVDLAGPGVNVYSSWPMTRRYRRISGTSMATPHVAGVAALLAEANPAVRGLALASKLTGTAKRLHALSSADVGAGLVQAP